MATRKQARAKNRAKSLPKEQPGTLFKRDIVENLMILVDPGWRGCTRPPRPGSRLAAQHEAALTVADSIKLLAATMALEIPRGR